MYQHIIFINIRFVQGFGDPSNIEEVAFGGFTRFPRWMWRNREVVEFVQWLREYNDSHSNPHDKVGFYGMDLYSLFESIEEVIRYLDEHDPEAAKRARKHYSCFQKYGEDSQAYGYATAMGLSKSCEDGAVKQLMEMYTRSMKNTTSSMSESDELFYAKLNAKIVKQAEHYYRSMFTESLCY